jgi:hypothetical protein
MALGFSTLSASPISARTITATTAFGAVIITGEAELMAEFDSPIAQILRGARGFVIAAEINLITLT